MRILIAYLTYSGNTEEIDQHIENRMVRDGTTVDMYEIGINLVPDMQQYDYIFIGMFTLNYGAIPDEVKEFILEVGYKPESIAIFGSGDTKFGGEDVYCKAVDKLVTFYESKWDGLKIEQSPRGSQEACIDQWLEGVLEDVYSTT